MVQSSLATELARFGPGARGAQVPTREEAAVYCRKLARRSYENFTVASWLLPRKLKPHFFAIYAFCRWADDLADEVGDRARSLQLLDWWHNQLELCYAGTPQHPVFVALRETILLFEIPPEPFVRLLTAFRQDQQVTRYTTHKDVLAYCRNSANPVGRLILYLGRCHDEPRCTLSDSICTGLQLANFCQDVARDWAKGRIYLPRATLDRACCGDGTFVLQHHSESFREALRVEVERAEGYLRAGQPLVGLMPAELRLDVALFIAGGLAILQAIRDCDYDVWSRRPTVTKGNKLRLLMGCWWNVRRLPSKEAS